MIDQIFNAQGGTEQNLSFLIRKLPRDDFNILLVVLRNIGPYDKAFFPIDPMFIHFRSFYSAVQLFSAISQLGQLIDQHHIDVIHTFFPDGEILGLLVSRLKKNCTLVATRRNMGFRHSWASLWRTRLTNQFIPRFLANSEKIKEHVGRLEWISQKRIEVIYNPLQKDRIEQGLREPLSKDFFGIHRGEQVVGIVANLTPVKDYPTFLRAARLISNKNPQTKFIIVGGLTPGWKRELESLASDLGLDSSLIFAGNHDNPVSIIKLFDVGVLCSKSEGLSNSLIEYAAVGLPSVATDVGGNPEVVIHGKTGFLVPPSSHEQLAEDILKLLKNEELRKAFGQNAKKMAEERFGQDLILSAYKKYYSKIIYYR